MHDRDRRDGRSGDRRDSREVCTLKVTQLTAKVRAQDLADYFNDAARVRDVDLPRDARSGRHKGYAYVEVASREDVAVCVLLNGAVPTFQKYAIDVTASKEYLSLPAVDADSKDESNGSAASDAPRVFLGAIPRCVDEAALLPVLSFYGQLSSLRMGEQNGQRHAFATYTREAAASQAAAALQGFRLAGSALRAEFLRAGEAEASDAELASQGVSALAGPVRGTVGEFVELKGVPKSAAGDSAGYETGIEALLRRECVEAGAEAVYFKYLPAVDCVLWEFMSAAAAEKAVRMLHGRWLGGMRLSCAYLEETDFHQLI